MSTKQNPGGWAGAAVGPQWATEDQNHYNRSGRICQAPIHKPSGPQPLSVCVPKFLADLSAHFLAIGDEKAAARCLEATWRSVGRGWGVVP